MSAIGRLEYRPALPCVARLLLRGKANVAITNHVAEAVAVRDRGGRACFAKEPQAPFGIRRERLGEDRQRDGAVQSFVERAVDDPHPTAPEEPIEAEGSQHVAGNAAPPHSAPPRPPRRGLGFPRPGRSCPAPPA